MTPENRVRDAEAELRDFALGYPEATEAFPWGERVIKVKGKVFVFMGVTDKQLGLSVKLPQSAQAALGLPFASPTRYGLGRSGWVTLRFSAAAARMAMRLIFLALLAAFFLRSRWLPDVAGTGALISLLVTAAALLALRRRAESKP